MFGAVTWLGRRRDFLFFLLFFFNSHLILQTLHMNRAIGRRFFRGRASRFSGTVQEGKHRWNKNKGCDGSTEQTADNGAAERRVLFATFAEPERHGNHADDHGQGRHQDGPETRKASLQGGLNRVAVGGELLLGKRDHQNTVGGGYAHTHDGTHKSGNAEGGVGDEQENHDTGQSAAGSP